MATSFLHSRISLSSCYKRLVHLSLNTTTMQPPPFQARSLASRAKKVPLFDKMNVGDERKYYMFGGKGGVGKTSYAASLAVKFANHGHPTMVVSTDPAHSLSHSFDQINLEKWMEDHGVSPDVSAGVSDLMNREGLGTVHKQLIKGKLEEFFAKATYESSMIYGTMQVAESDEFITFTRIVFDTAPMVDKFQILSELSRTDIIEFDSPTDKMTDKLRQSLEEKKHVRRLFSEATEFIIVTTPTVMAVEESSQLHASLKKINVPVRRLILDPILPPFSTDCEFPLTKEKALEMIRNDPELGNLDLIGAPLVDMEIRGIPALKIMGDMLWK